MSHSSSEEQRIVEEYLALNERSQQLFAGLRDVPLFGKQWQPYFQRVFELFSKLWKFQQIHRVVLETKERSKLKRHDIGEIASKIGQLYYNYYLRTSETNYLFEAYLFYEAIKERGYFNNIVETKSASLLVKKLRYYARFIIVCLLLNYKQVAETLASEFASNVEAYTKNYRPDHQEWQYVLNEIAMFLEAENIVKIENGSPVSRRLSYSSRSVSDDSNTPKTQLQEVILVGNFTQQVKCSELTLDMFRMAQALEREIVLPNPDGENKNPPSESVKEPDERQLAWRKKRNPHKYLLFRPTVSQLGIFLANSFKELLDENVTLLYLSADGIQNPIIGETSDSDAQIQEEPDNIEKDTDSAEESSTNDDQQVPIRGSIISPPNRCNLGGIALNSHRSPEKQQSGFNSDCLYAEDLITYTRKHLFLIIESDNSQSFTKIPNLFGKQVLCLMAAPKLPDDLQDANKSGSLFTFFLCDPLLAFTKVIGKTVISKELYTECQSIYEKFATEFLDNLSNLSLHGAFELFLQDEFLARFILNFIFCLATFMYHKSFQVNNREYFPSAYPCLPPEIFHHIVLQKTIYELAGKLDGSDMLVDQLNSPVPYYFFPEQQ